MSHKTTDGCERWDRESGYCIEGADCSCRPARYVCLAGCGYRSNTLTPRAGTLGRLGYTIPTCPDCGHSLGVSADWWAS